jgi:hypothetical protein
MANNANSRHIASHRLKLHQVEEEQETKLKMTEELREGLLENEPGAQSKKSNRIRRRCVPA